MHLPAGLHGGLAIPSKQGHWLIPSSHSEGEAVWNIGIKVSVTREDQSLKVVESVSCFMFSFHSITWRHRVVCVCKGEETNMR